jgi:hypothetical protein
MAVFQAVTRFSYVHGACVYTHAVSCVLMSDVYSGEYNVFDVTQVNIMFDVRCVLR